MITTDAKMEAFNYTKSQRQLDKKWVLKRKWPGENLSTKLKMESPKKIEVI